MTDPLYLMSGCNGARTCNGPGTVTAQITGILVTDSATIFTDIKDKNGDPILEDLIEFPLNPVDAGTWLTNENGISTFTTSAGKVNYSIA